MKNIELTLKKNDDLIWGRTSGDGWMPTPYGVTVDEVINNLKQLVEAYTANEGKNDKSGIIFVKIKNKFTYIIQPPDPT